MFGSRFGISKRSHPSSSEDSRGTGFMRLKGKPSQATMKDEILLEHGITTVPNSYRGDKWKEIHITRDFEQRSVNGRMSDDSQKDLYQGYPKTMAVPR